MEQGYSAFVQIISATLTNMPTSIRSKLKAALLTGLIGLCSLTAASTSAESMPTFSIKYTLENDFVTAGRANFKLLKKEDHYQLTLESRPTGMFKLSKKGKITEVAELPSLDPPFLSSKYSYTNFGDQDRSYSSLYDRDNGEATITRESHSSHMPIDSAAVDRLSMTLALMQQLHDEPNIEKFSIEALDTDGTQTFSFVSKGQVQLKTELGNLTATRIDRLRTNSNRNTITWFAEIGPNALPVPVQIEQYKRDKMIVRLKITNFSVIE